MKKKYIVYALKQIFINYTSLIILAIVFNTITNILEKYDIKFNPLFLYPLTIAIILAIKETKIKIKENSKT